MTVASGYLLFSTPRAIQEINRSMGYIQNPCAGPNLLMYIVDGAVNECWWLVYSQENHVLVARELCVTYTQRISIFRKLKHVSSDLTSCDREWICWKAVDFSSLFRVEPWSTGFSHWLLQFHAYWMKMERLVVFSSQALMSPTYLEIDFVIVLLFDWISFARKQSHKHFWAGALVL